TRERRGASGAAPAGSEGDGREDRREADPRSLRPPADARRAGPREAPIGSQRGALSSQGERGQGPQAPALVPAEAWAALPGRVVSDLPALSLRHRRRARARRLA